MNPSELAEKMLKWEKDKRALDQLAAEIEAEVVRLGKSQVVGGCRVTYTKGRGTYDYVTPGKSVSGEILAKHSTALDVTNWEQVAKLAPDAVEKCTTTTFIYDWKAILEEAGIEPLLTNAPIPSATIKLEPTAPASG